MKYKINNCDEQGNIITGYEEVLEGTKEECENDYRHYYEYDGPIDIEEEANKKELRYCGYDFSHPKNITLKEALRDSNCKTVEELQEKASDSPLHLHLGHSGGMNYQVIYRSYEKGMEEGHLFLDEKIESDL